MSRFAHTLLKPPPTWVQSALLGLKRNVGKKRIPVLGTVHPIRLKRRSIPGWLPETCQCEICVSRTGETLKSEASGEDGRNWMVSRWVPDVLMHTGEVWLSDPAQDKSIWGTCGDGLGRRTLGIPNCKARLSSIIFLSAHEPTMEATVWVPARCGLWTWIKAQMMELTTTSPARGKLALLKGQAERNCLHAVQT